jgi:hypothetical protein
MDTAVVAAVVAAVVPPRSSIPSVITIKAIQINI